MSARTHRKDKLTRLTPDVNTATESTTTDGIEIEPFAFKFKSALKSSKKPAKSQLNRELSAPPETIDEIDFVTFLFANHSAIKINGYGEKSPISHTVTSTACTGAKNRLQSKPTARTL